MTTLMRTLRISTLVRPRFCTQKAIRLSPNCISPRPFSPLPVRSSQISIAADQEPLSEFRTGSSAFSPSDSQWQPAALERFDRITTTVQQPMNHELWQKLGKLPTARQAFRVVRTWCTLKITNWLATSVGMKALALPPIRQ